MLTWATTEDLGILAFATKKSALAASLQRGGFPHKCDFHISGIGWVLLDGISPTDAGEQELLTPDGRRIPVWRGWSGQRNLLGLRGGNARRSLAEEWRRIMVKVCDRTLAKLHQ